jgi:hypothetical protein
VDCARLMLWWLMKAVRIIQERRREQETKDCRDGLDWIIAALLGQCVKDSPAFPGTKMK